MAEPRRWTLLGEGGATGVLGEKLGLFYRVRVREDVVCDSDIEKAAGALYGREIGDPDPWQWRHADSDQKRYWRVMARAGLHAVFGES